MTLWFAQGKFTEWYGLGLVCKKWPIPKSKVNATISLSQSIRLASLSSASYPWCEIALHDLLELEKMMYSNCNILDMVDFRSKGPEVSLSNLHRAAICGDVRYKYIVKIFFPVVYRLTIEQIRWRDSCVATVASECSRPDGKNATSYGCKTPSISF